MKAPLLNLSTDVLKPRRQVTYNKPQALIAMPCTDQKYKIFNMPKFQRPPNSNPDLVDYFDRMMNKYPDPTQRTNNYELKFEDIRALPDVDDWDLTKLNEHEKNEKHLLEIKADPSLDYPSKYIYDYLAEAVTEYALWTIGKKGGFEEMEEQLYYYLPSDKDVVMMNAHRLSPDEWDEFIKRRNAKPSPSIILKQRTHNAWVAEMQKREEKMTPSSWRGTDKYQPKMLKNLYLRIVMDMKMLAEEQIRKLSRADYKLRVLIWNLWNAWGKYDLIAQSLGMILDQEPTKTYEQVLQETLGEKLDRQRLDELLLHRAMHIWKHVDPGLGIYILKAQYSSIGVRVAHDEFTSDNKEYKEYTYAEAFVHKLQSLRNVVDKLTQQISIMKSAMGDEAVPLPEYNKWIW